MVSESLYFLSLLSFAWRGAPSCWEIHRSSPNCTREKLLLEDVLIPFYSWQCFLAEVWAQMWGNPTHGWSQDAWLLARHKSFNLSLMFSLREVASSLSFFDTRLLSKSLLITVHADALTHLLPILSCSLLHCNSTAHLEVLDDPVNDSW